MLIIRIKWKKVVFLHYDIITIMNTEKLDVKKGIERLARVYCWPNEPTIADKDKYEFKALSEFVIFNVYVKKTFFTILHADLRNQTANLYRHLLSSVKDNTPSLSFKEAFLLFRLIGKKQTRSILDAISCPPSTYNGILESIDNLDYELFVSSFEDYDNRQTFQVLWQVRYILYGTNYAWDHSKPTEQLSSSCFNEWSRDEDKYQSYFSEIPEKYEDDFVRQKVLDIIGFEDSSKKKRRIRCPNHSSSYEAFVDEYIHYSEKESGKSLLNSQWKDLLVEFNDNIDFPSKNSWKVTSNIENLARLILTHNVILHKDEVMEKYGIDSSEMYNEFINSDVYVYEDGDCKDLGRYILYCTCEMLFIYNMVENILDDDSKRVLKSILYSSRYTALLESLVFSSASQETDELQNADNETIESFIPAPIVHEMTESAKTDNNVSNRNDINAIVLHLPRLLEKYRDKYCVSMANRGKGCTKEMIEYYLWGGDKIPQNAISEDKPLVWTGTRQMFVAYIRFLYLENNDSGQRILSAAKRCLESSVILDGKPLEYTSISSKTLENNIKAIKKEIDWNEEDNKKEKVVKHEMFR